MAYRNLPGSSTHKALVLDEEDESEPSIPIGRTPRPHDEESHVRQPPKPAELDSLNTEPDPDLQLTPMKQKEQPKGVLRTRTKHSKVRHRVRFQESGSLSCESESDPDSPTKISEITGNVADCGLIENGNNNNGDRGDDLISDVAAPNSSNCMFFDVSSSELAPDLVSVEVVREKNLNQNPPPPSSISDFPPRTNSKTVRNIPSKSQPYRKTDYENEISLPEPPAESMIPKDIYFENIPEKENGTTVKKKAAKINSSRPSHSKISSVSADSYPSSLRTSPLPVDVSVADKEPSIFGQPQLHSTLQIAQKIKTLQKKRPDLTSELKKNLEKEEQRNKINGKAAFKVDICSNQDLFTGLISLDVSNLQLEEAAVIQKTAKVKYPKKKQTTSGLEPDLLEFFTEDLQKESADFSLPGIPKPTIATCQAPSLIAFDLYRHNRMWEGLPGTT